MGTIINNFGEINSNQTPDKEKEYLAYISQHRNYVIEAAYELFFNNTTDPDTDLFTMQEYADAKFKLKDRVPVHDNSKYDNEEFPYYRAKWYPTEEEIANPNPDILENYQEAWKHHYLNNDHHVEYWFYKNNAPQDMSLDAIMEMICDWEAVSRYNSGSIREWYQNSAVREKKCMTDNTKKIVEFFLDFLFPIDYDDKKHY